MQPKVSIQIPTFNQQEFIQKTIESCLMQDYPNLEINIADDHSTDDAYKVIQPFLVDNRIRYYRNKTNIGRVANYHKALYEYATGEWAINLDGDDYFIDSSFISKAIELITTIKDENIVMYQANHDLNKISGVLPSCIKINEETLLVDGSGYFINYYKILHFYHCATIYKRKEALKLGFYTFPCLYTDFNSVAKLFLKGKILLSSRTVAYWSRHEHNQSGTLDGKKIANEIGAMNELAVFASTILPAERVEEWRIKMKGYLLSIYIDLQSTAKQKRVALKQVILNFSLEKTHIRQLLKAMLGSIGINK